jgi:hypothetical protein
MRSDNYRMLSNWWLEFEGGCSDFLENWKWGVVVLGMVV